jgi:hypothetical protein
MKSNTEAKANRPDSDSLFSRFECLEACYFCNELNLSINERAERKKKSFRNMPASSVSRRGPLTYLPAGQPAVVSNDLTTKDDLKVSFVEAKVSMKVSSTRFFFWRSFNQLSLPSFFIIISSSSTSFSPSGPIPFFR